MRETGPVRFVPAQSPEEAEAAKPYIGIARTQLGITKNLMRLGGLQSMPPRRVVLADGTVIVSQSVFGNDIVQITPTLPAVEAARQALAQQEDAVLPEVPTGTIVVIGYANGTFDGVFKSRACVWRNGIRTLLEINWNDAPAIDSSALNISDDGKTIYGYIVDSESNTQIVKWVNDGPPELLYTGDIPDAITPEGVSINLEDITFEYPVYSITVSFMPYQGGTGTNLVAVIETEDAYGTACVAYRERTSDYVQGGTAAEHFAYELALAGGGITGTVVYSEDFNYIVPGGVTTYATFDNGHFSDAASVVIGPGGVSIVTGVGGSLNSFYPRAFSSGVVANISNHGAFVSGEVDVMPGYHPTIAGAIGPQWASPRLWSAAGALLATKVSPSPTSFMDFGVADSGATWANIYTDGLGTPYYWAPGATTGQALQPLGNLILNGISDDGHTVFGQDFEAATTAFKIQGLTLTTLPGLDGSSNDNPQHASPDGFAITGTSGGTTVVWTGGAASVLDQLYDCRAVRVLHLPA